MISFLHNPAEAGDVKVLKKPFPSAYLLDVILHHLCLLDRGYTQECRCTASSEPACQLSPGDQGIIEIPYR